MRVICENEEERIKADEAFLGTIAWKLVNHQNDAADYVSTPLSRPIELVNDCITTTQNHHDPDSKV